MIPCSSLEKYSAEQIFSTKFGKVIYLLIGFLKGCVRACVCVHVLELNLPRWDYAKGPSCCPHPPNGTSLKVGKFHEIPELQQTLSLLVTISSRAVEGEIFQLGMRLQVLKESIDQASLTQPAAGSDSEMTASPSSLPVQASKPQMRSPTPSLQAPIPAVRTPYPEVECPVIPLMLYSRQGLDKVCTAWWGF